MPRRLLLVPILLAAACGSDDGGQYRITWTLFADGAPTTCAAEQIVNVRVTTTDTVTSDTRTATAPCTDAELVTDSLALGSHTIEVRALGTLGENAGVVMASGALTTAGDVIQPPTAEIDTLPAETTFIPSWLVLRAGQPTTCSAVGSTGVRVETRIAGGELWTDTWFCTAQGTAIDVPLGEFSVGAVLLGAGDQPIVRTTEEQVPPTRGVFERTFVLDVP